MCIQASGLPPAPVTPDTPSKKEVAALREQLDKLLNDLEVKSHELQATSQAHADLKGVLKQAAEGHCSTESTLNAQIAALRSELKFKTHELQAESQARAEVELALKAAAQGGCEIEGQTVTALQQDLESSSRRAQALETELADQQQMLAGQQELAGKQQELAGLRQELAGMQQKLAGVQQVLEGKQQEVQAAGQAYAELEEVLARASEEQIVSEDKLVVQMTSLQDEVKVNRT
jgi:chromosome segregation ATPase